MFLSVEMRTATDTSFQKPLYQPIRRQSKGLLHIAGKGVVGEWRYPSSEPVGGREEVVLEGKVNVYFTDESLQLEHNNNLCLI
jgi:hypothetical protein